MKLFLKNANSESLNKELEWNKIESPSYEELVSFYENNFNNDEKKELEGYVADKSHDIYYFIVKSYICDVMKLDMSWWITAEMFVEGTVEYSYYKNFIEGQKQPWEK